MSEYHKKNMIIQSLQKAQPVYLPKPHHEDFLLPWPLGHLSNCLLYTSKTAQFPPLWHRYSSLGWLLVWKRPDLGRYLPTLLEHFIGYCLPSLCQSDRKTRICRTGLEYFPEQSMPLHRRRKRKLRLYLSEQSERTKSSSLWPVCQWPGLGNGILVGVWPGFQVNEEMPKVRPIVLSCIQL